ncbi:hypothetical protein PgNI_05429 [Pyricularia grisea]|uniref:Uncharacterized protein n=1 Tax=Pyricularia grisea TaxID=148305 RepID=A0A6P8B4D2_PYRGI|nr:hypothetical protein PgNI_05429 [Pyricularia grisea]TLD10191.1 hypothetical protein PgNI_05429 [Pyricularia grisea]
MFPTWSMQRGDILPFRLKIWYPSSQSGNLAVLLACTVVTASE